MPIYALHHALSVLDWQRQATQQAFQHVVRAGGFDEKDGRELTFLAPCDDLAISGARAHDDVIELDSHLYLDRRVRDSRGRVLALESVNSDLQSVQPLNRLIPCAANSQQPFPLVSLA